MYTMEIRPFNRAAKKLANPRMFRDSLIRQIPILADATYGILVKEAVNRGFLDFAMSVTLDPKRGRIYTIPGAYVQKGQAKGMEATTQKAMAKDMLERAKEKAGEGDEKAVRGTIKPTSEELSSLIKAVAPRAFDAVREDMVEELA
jgi:hypothetical protein